MVRVGLIGLGFMGRGHLENYIRLEKEGFDVKLVAVCDIDQDKFSGTIAGNLEMGAATYDFSPYARYTDYKKMIAEQELDYVDIVTPTYEHAEMTVYALDQGLHVFCEKPMAMNPAECDKMLEAAKRNNRHLMIGQVLRFWPEYRLLKEITDSGRLGKPLHGQFFRGGGAPRWSYQNWMLNAEKSGGALLDQHIHDVDAVHWIFGRPTAVSTVAATVIPGSRDDALSTHYRFNAPISVSAQNNWSMEGYGFGMLYRVSFEKGTVIYEAGSVSVFDAEGKPVPFTLQEGAGYYLELKHFIDVVANRDTITDNKPASSRDTIAVAMAEMQSAKQNGDWVQVSY